MKDNPPPNEPTGAVRTPVRRTSLRRVAAASSIGTTIEFYDFFIYGTAAALVFPTVFFPAADPSTATLASFATFAVAFFARPVGAILFGHFGDRIGRKRTLVWTLLIMGFATVAIGLLPGYDSGAFGLFPDGIGIWAPVLLVAMRFLQGFAVGGEWAGATLLTAEYAPPGKRGLYAMFPQLGPAFAFFLSSATFLIASRTLGTTSDAFLDYGWRIPFLLSFALVGVGLWVRLAVAETPVFRDRVREHAPAARNLPFLDAVRYQPKEILIAAGALTSLFSLFYTGTAFLTSYGVGTLKPSRDYILTMGCSPRSSSAWPPRPPRCGRIEWAAAASSWSPVPPRCRGPWHSSRFWISVVRPPSPSVCSAPSRSSVSPMVRRVRCCRRCSRPATATPVRAWATTWRAFWAARCRR